MSQNIENFKKNATAVIEQAQVFINAPETQEKYRVDGKHFSRSGKLPFSLTCQLLLSNMCNTTQVELYKKLFINDLPQVTDSSFCKNRYKIKADFFVELNVICIAMLYEIGKNELKTWHNFTLLAIDGTSLQLPDKADIRDHFGTHKNGSANGTITHTTMGRCLLEEDVLNKVFTRVELFPIAKSELAATYDWILKPNDIQGLRLFDRNFGSFLVMYLMQQAEQDFAIRMKTSQGNAVKAFLESGEEDAIVTFTAYTNLKHGGITVKKGTEMWVRLVKVVLSTGEIEVLATSLLNQTEYPHSEFGALYNLRWGVETAIDVLKNKFELMSFLAHKAQGIYQEVYATIFDYNIQQLLIEPAQVTVNEQFVKKKQRVKH